MLKKIYLFGREHFVSLHFLRFLIAGSINTLIDFTIFMLLASHLHINVVVANITSTSIALCGSFLLNKYFVFRAEGTGITHFVQFVVWTIINVWIIQTLIILGARSILNEFIVSIWLLNALTKVMGIGISMVLNFLRYKAIFHRQSS
jgi:putative flippase GtrA